MLTKFGIPIKVLILKVKGERQNNTLNDKGIN